MTPPGVLARVIAAFGRHFLVDDASGATRLATRRGKRSDVIVGDRVVVTVDPSGQAVIEEVLARSGVLKRAEGAHEKLLAADIDQIAIVFAARPVFNPHFIWRALIAAHDAGIGARVILNKTDLAETSHARAFLAALARLGVATHEVSAKTAPAQTAAALIPALRDHHTLLVGQSGMGKSTLLNLLVPDAGARTQEFSQRLNLGRQTTTASRWFNLPGGGALVDSPGFQSFGLHHLDAAALVAAMPDLAAAAAAGCRFADCRHLGEPGCAVTAALERGTIDPARHAFYRLLVAELRG